MGRVERMLLNFCQRENWGEEDEKAMSRLAKKAIANKKSDLENYKIVSMNVWRCFYRRNPDVVRSASKSFQFVQRFLEKFETEDAASAIDAMLASVKTNGAEV